MSAALSKALNSGELKVKKVASGEAIIVFRNPVSKTDEKGGKYTVTIKPVSLTGNKVIDLFARKDVDSEAINQSNIKGLLQMGAIEIV